MISKTANEFADDCVSFEHQQLLRKLNFYGAESYNIPLVDENLDCSVTTIIILID